MKITWDASDHFGGFYHEPISSFCLISSRRADSVASVVLNGLCVVVEPQGRFCDLEYFFNTARLVDPWVDLEKYQTCADRLVVDAPKSAQPCCSIDRRRNIFFIHIHSADGDEEWTRLGRHSLWIGHDSAGTLTGVATAFIEDPFGQLENDWIKEMFPIMSGGKHEKP